MIGVFLDRVGELWRPISNVPSLSSGEDGISRSCRFLFLPLRRAFVPFFRSIAVSADAAVPSQTLTSVEAAVVAAVDFKIKDNVVRANMAPVGICGNMSLAPTQVDKGQTY